MNKKKRLAEGRVIFHDMKNRKSINEFTKSMLSSWIAKRWPESHPLLDSVYIVEFYKQKNTTKSFGCDIEIAVGLETWSASGTAETLLWAFRKAFSSLKREVTSSAFVWSDEDRNRELRMFA